MSDPIQELGNELVQMLSDSSISNTPPKETLPQTEESSSESEEIPAEAVEPKIQEVQIHSFYTTISQPPPWEVDSSLSEERAKEIEEIIEGINFDSILKVETITPQSLMDGLRINLKNSVRVQELSIVVSRASTIVQNKLELTERYYEKLINHELMGPHVKNMLIGSQPERRIRAESIVEQWRCFVSGSFEVVPLRDEISKLQYLVNVWNNLDRAVTSKYRIIKQADKYGVLAQKILANHGTSAINNGESRYFNPETYQEVDEPTDPENTTETPG